MYLMNKNLNKTGQQRRPLTKRHPLGRLLRRRMRLLISGHPTLYYCYAKLAKLPFQINETTTVLVDSYPRSANSFFEAAFSKAHGGRESVAHHSHAAGQVRLGLKRKLPCIVLIRNPVSAIVSFYEMNEGSYSIEVCTLEYIKFYGALEELIDKITVLETVNIENRFYDLMEMMRDRYGLSVEPFTIDAATRAELFQTVDETGLERNGHVERYSGSLNVSEKQYRQTNLASIKDRVCAPENAARLSRAMDLYKKFQSHAF
jgi:hypothetical protein